MGFDAQQQKTMTDYQKNIPIQLINCEVKPSRQGHGYELMLKSGTQIKESPKKLDVPALINATDTGPKTVTLDALPTMGIFEKVTTAVKAIVVKEPDSVGDKQRQDVIVADETGTARVCLWEDDINKLVENSSYRLQNFTVSEYQSTKYLSVAREGTEIVSIADIGIVSEAVRDEHECTTINNVQVIGVPLLDKYRACLQCKARVEPLTPPLGKCTKADCQRRLDTVM